MSVPLRLAVWRDMDDEIRASFATPWSVLWYEPPPSCVPGRGPDVHEGQVEECREVVALRRLGPSWSLCCCSVDRRKHFHPSVQVKACVL